MSAGVAHAPALGSASFRELLSPLKRARGAKRNESRPERKSLEQLLASERWTPTRRTSPELAKVLGFVQAELGEARRLLARRRKGEAHRTRASERELRALLLEDAPIPSVDRGWEVVGALKRLNLRLGDQSYIAGLLEYESAHVHDAAHWHTWDEHFPKTELRRLLGVYRAGRATPAQLALAVDRLTFLYLKRAEAGRNRRAVAALKRLYLSRLALALLALLVALGASADFTSRDDLWKSFTLAACAGALGSTLSGVLRLRDHLVRLDELRGFWPAMRVQPLVGASAGALVFMLLSSNAVSISSLSADAWSSPGLLGFVAGFSEPFFLGLVDRVAVIPDRRPQEATTPLAESHDRAAQGLGKKASS
jgi:hypothetical protein